MKKIIMLLILMFTLVINYNVNAKDTVSQDTKYNEDTYKYIINGYDKKGNKDGHLAAGTYTSTKNNNENDEIIIVKYNKDEKIEWSYVNETEETENNLYSINYIYQDNRVIGYLISTRENDISYFIKIDLNGELIEKSEQASNQFTKSTKEIIINNNFYGYITTGQILIDNKNIGVITKYNENLEIEWTKYYNNEEYSELSINDVIPLTDNEKILGYNIILNLKNEDANQYRLIRLDNNGEEISLIKDNFEEKDNPKIEKTAVGYILYGYTHEIKINNSKSQSYYIIKYNDNDEIEWETIGTINVNPNKPLKLQIINENNEEKYLLMTTNSQDQSLEITKIKKDGVIENKIKKINNNYYDIKTFLFDNNIIYFVGQINCVEDEKCTYNKKSLYLISDEDKVIEVKDNDSKLILVITILLTVGVTIIVILKRKKLKEI